MKHASVVLIAILLCIPACVNAAPILAKTVTDAGAYDVTVSIFNAARHIYQWDVTFNGCSLPGTAAPAMRDFAIYNVGTTPLTVASHIPATAWRGIVPGAALMEWRVIQSRNAARAGQHLTFIARLSGDIADPWQTAIKVYSGSMVYWISGGEQPSLSHTPELSTLLLGAIGAGCLPVLMRRRRA